MPSLHLSQNHLIKEQIEKITTPQEDFFVHKYTSPRRRFPEYSEAKLRNLGWVRTKWSRLRTKLTRLFCEENKMVSTSDKINETILRVGEIPKTPSENSQPMEIICSFTKHAKPKDRQRRIKSDLNPKRHRAFYFQFEIANCSK